MVSTEATNPIRVVLGDMPDLLRRIVQDVLDDDPNLQLMGYADSTAALEDLVQETEPNVIIVTIPNSDLPVHTRRFPATTVIAITPDGRHLVTSNADVGSEHLRDAVRSAFRSTERSL